MKELKNDLKNKTFKPVYLLYGEERFLVEHYAQALNDALLPDAGSALMNRDGFTGKDAPAERIINAANTLPFLNDTRVVQVKDSGLFAAGRKADSEALAEYLPQTPESTVLIFVETDVDKRGRLFKQASAVGRVAECTAPPQNELLKWVKNIFNKKGKSISPENSLRLLRTVSHQMIAILAEAEKIAAHTGNRAEVTDEDIDAVCTPSLETRIFDLIGAVGNHKAPEALRLYRNMLLLKESPLMVLTMMARQFRLILQCKAAQERKLPPPETARVLELRSFIVDECLRQGRFFSVEKCVQALQDCLDMDIRIKTGLMSAELGVEILIIKYANKERESA
jgi:DNA polymerase-3 subunit delta